MQPRLNFANHRHWLTAVILCVLIFTIYLSTIAQDLTFEHQGTDGGDLAAAAWNLGIPHPPGYPTYTILAWFFTRLPIGTIAFRTNLMSAAFGAAAIVFVALAAWELQPPEGRSLVLPVATGGILAFSTLYWSQSVITEVYSLLGFFAACLLWLLIRWRAGAADWHLYLAGFLLGLGMGNHLSLVFIVPGAAVLLWSQRQRWFHWQIILPIIGFTLLGLSIYLYLPLAARGNPPVNWGNPQTWKEFLWMITAKQYQPFVFGLAPEEIPGRLGSWFLLFSDQFGWWGLIIAALGGYAFWIRDHGFFLSTLTWSLPLLVYAFMYETSDSYVILIPLFINLAIWWGEGARVLILIGDQVTERSTLPSTTLPVFFWRWWPRIVILLLPLASLSTHYQQIDVSQDTGARSYIDQVLESLPHGSLVLTRRDQPTFSLWYEVYANEKRPDLAVINGRMLAFKWYRDQVRQRYPDLVIPVIPSSITSDELVRSFIEQNLEVRPVYATDPYEAWEVWFNFVPQGDAPVYLVSSKDLNGSREMLHHVVFSAILNYP